MDRDLITTMKAHSSFFLLFFLFAAMFLTNIGSYQQFLRAESNFSLGARMMVETNEFLLPHSPHEAPLNKPPLHYWLIGISYKIFGFDHGASRIPSALCGLGVIMLVYILGLRFRDQLLGLTASAILGTSYMFWSFSRLSMPDMLLTLCVTAALSCWILVLTAQTQHPRALALIGYGAVAMGFLTKGPIAIVLVAFPICLEILITRDITILRKLYLISGSLVFLLIATPYFLLVYIYNGIEPLWNFFIGQNLGRFTGSVAPRAPKTFLVYEIGAFSQDFLPWTPLLIIAACSLGRWKDFDHTTRRQLRLLGLWILSPIIFFSFSSFKLDYYFLPVMPPAALLVTLILLQDGVIPLWARRVRATIAVLVVILLPILIYFTIQVVKVNFPDTPLSWLPHIVSLMLFIPTIWFAIRGPLHRALLACSFTLWAAMFLAFLFLVPDYTRFHPTPMLAAKVPTSAHVYTLGNANEWGWDLAMYLPTSQPVKALPRNIGSRELDRVLETDPDAFMLVYEKDYEELLKKGVQLQVAAQAEAYKGNKLTLKSLLRPSRENLYLVTQ